MAQELLIGLGIIVLFGMIAQWMAWRLHLPAILLLLVLGIIAGPVSGLVDTQKLFGNLLFPFVSLSVSIILWLFSHAHTPSGWCIFHSICFPFARWY